MDSASASDRSREDVSLRQMVAQRYRILAELGRGGMGVVYRASDETTGELVALKQLLSDSPDARRRFEREYRTLAGLDHPFIIDVYDYGVDQDGTPYFTMELLSGSDLRSLPPQSVPRLCSHIRDVASSLALLHARRLLHRDLSPRNVRASSDGRAKLIDFGALTPFGVPQEIIGTPPCVPPEALAGASLDQRADLFALGALAYFVFTGRHAYPARRMHDLPVVWRQTPPRPSALRQDLPEELDHLVMSLLSPDALARPATAAEVIDRLNSIGGLEPEALDLGQAYLARPVLAGREISMREMATLQSRARKGRGGALLVRGATGSGKSRVLDELALTCQIGGGVVLTAHGGDHRAPYSTVRALARIAHDKAPTETSEAARRSPAALAAAVPELAPEDAPAGGSAQDAQERRAQMQQAIQCWFSELADRVDLLAIVVDDLTDVDEASAAALVALSFEAPRRRLLLAYSAPKEPRGPSEAIIRAALETSQLMELPDLAQEDVLVMMRSLFGDTPHLARVSKWVFQASDQTPAGVLERTQELVRHKQIRYVDGVWVLPQELSPEAFSGADTGRASARIDHLGGDARRLLRALSVQRGRSTFEECKLLCSGLDERALADAIDLLVTEGHLVAVEGGHRFARDAFRRQLFMELSGKERRELHLLLGHHLADADADRDLVGVLDAGWHLLNGGETTRGAELLAQAGQRLTEDGTLLAEAAPALEAALRVYRSENRPKTEQLDLLVPLSIAGYMVDRQYADRYGEETFDLLVEMTGLRRARRFGRVLGSKRGLVAGTIAAVGKLAIGRGTQSRDLKRLYVHLVIVSIVLAGVAGLTADEPRLRRIVEALEPLASLPEHEIGSLLYSYCRLLHLTRVGMESECVTLGYELDAMLADRTRFRELTDETRASWKGGLLFAIAIYECWKVDDSALRLAESMEATGLAMHRMFANQVRMLYHAYRGEVNETQRYRESVERHAVEGGTTWQAELVVPLLMIVPLALAEDLVGLKRCAEEIEVLSRGTPALRLYYDLASALVKHHRGQSHDAARLLESVCERMPIGGAAAWQAARANLAEALLGAGDVQQAKRVMDEVRAHMKPEDRQFAVMVFVVERAHARVLQLLGDHTGAARLLDELLDELAGAENPLIVGLAHAERTKVAIAVGDSDTFSRHLERAHTLLRATRNPVLVILCEHLGRAGKEAFGESAVSPGEERLRVESLVLDAIGDSSSTEMRANRTLGLLAAEAGATSGMLYVPAGTTLRRVASLNASTAPQGEEEALEARVEEHRRLLEAMTRQVGDEDASETASVGPSPDAKAQTHAALRLVITSQGAKPEIVAAALLWCDGDAPNRPSSELLDAVARALTGVERTPTAHAAGGATPT